ncbi:MAG TPA: putative porin, partial [Myxococcaceae bacterium]|nr:putative porin [Myxococcaceae bacterium]
MASPPTARAEDPTEQRLRALEEQLRKAQRELQELRDQAQQQRAIGQAAQKQAEQTAEESKAAAAEAKKGFELPDWVKKTTLFGDLRLRHEGFYHQPVTEAGQKPDPNLRPPPPTSATARNRERLRARLGLKTTFSDELSATLRVTSGDPNNPISTNEDLTGDFTRKHVNLDWAFLTFSPGASFGIRPGAVSLTGGKFPNPIFRVGEMVFDEDLSPEGASETFQLLPKPMGAFDQIKVYALQWTFAEVSNGPDGWMFGGQVNPALHFGAIQVEGGFGQFWWLNPDLIAQALSKNTTSFNASGQPIANPNFNSSLVNTNLLVTKTIQPPSGPSGTPPSFTAITGYQSGFNQTSATVAATVPHLLLDQPLRLFADYVYNWQAAIDDAHGWQAGMRLGQTRVRGDWSVYGLYEHIGQEAAISAFTYSD